MTKKILTLAVAVVMIIGLIAGCGSNENGNATSKALTQTSDPASSKPSENFNATGYPIVNEPITVTAMYEQWGTFGDPSEMSYWKKMEEVSNIHIKWTEVNAGDDGSGLDLYFAAGEFPDFFHTSIDSERIRMYGVEGGKFADISKSLYEYMPNLVSWFSEFPEAEKVIRETNRAVYALPTIMKASTSAKGQMFYRTDYIDKVGLATPNTVDEFYNVLSAVKKAGLTGGFAPLLPKDAWGYWGNIEPFLFSAFGEATDAYYADNGAGKVIFNHTSEQYKRYLEFLNKLYTDGLLEMELFTIDSETTSARVKSGQAAFMTYAAELQEGDFEDGIIHLDCLAPLTSTYTNTKKIMAADFVGVWGGAINADSKYVKELLRMCDINYSKEEVVPGSGLNCLSMNYGIRGVDWDYTDSTKASYRLNAPADLKGSIWDYITNKVSWGMYYGAHVDLATSETGNNKAREQGMLKNNMAYAVPAFPEKHLKYTSEEINTIGNKQTDIDTYTEQMIAKFITGIEPLSNWDAYVSQVQKMGIEDVLAAKQTAYDRWNAIK